MVKIKPVSPDADFTSVLIRWPSEDTLTTSDMIDLIGRSESTVYNWLMRLSTYGYVDRETIIPGDGGNRRIKWTITNNGRQRAADLQKEFAS